MLIDRTEKMVREIYDNLVESMPDAPAEIIQEFIDNADRDLSDPAVAYAWGRLLGAAEVLNCTVLELLDECNIVPEDETPDNTCPDCEGTGIGRSGPPDVSRCDRCKGRSELKPEPDYEPDSRD